MTPRVEAIVSQVVARDGLDRDKVLSKRPAAGRVCNAARFEIWYRIRTEITINGKPASWLWIGQQFGYHHSSVIHGVRRHAAENPSAVEWRAAA